jgi:hypothetical protein
METSAHPLIATISAKKADLRQDAVRTDSQECESVSINANQCQSMPIIRLRNTLGKYNTLHTSCATLEATSGADRLSRRAQTCSDQIA